MALTTDPNSLQPNLMGVAWQTVEIDDADLSTWFYTLGGGAWTVHAAQVRLYQYAVIGQIVLVRLYLDNTSTGAGMGTILYVRLPEELEIDITKNAYLGVGWFHVNLGTPTANLHVRMNAGNVVEIWRDTVVAYPSSRTQDLTVQAVFSLALNIAT